jgi:hypothetical protein
MAVLEPPQVEGSSNIFARVMEPAKVEAGYRGAAGSSSRTTPRLNLNPESVKNGLGRLVLTLVKLLHELLERQALRRMEAGYLSEEEIERLGLTLMQQAQEIDRLRKEFRLEEADLNLDLGPLGQLL